MDNTLLISFLMTSCIADILVIVVVTFICHRQNKSVMEQYAKEMEEKFNFYKQQLENQNALLSNNLVDMVRSQKETLESYKHIDKELFTTFSRIKQVIKVHFYDTASNINASRLAIYLFHNGQSSSHGFSFVKMSCICEKVAIGSGVREHLMEHSNIPINLFDDMVDQLCTEGKYIVMNDDTRSSETSRRLFISSNKIKYAQLVAVPDNENNILGFICAEMQNDYSREGALKEKEKLDALINQIRPILSYSDYAQITVETNPINTQHD